MKKDLKIFFSIIFVLSLVFVAVIFIASTVIGNLSYTRRGVDKIPTENGIYSDTEMLERIGDYDELYFQSHHKNMLIFSSRAYALIAGYSPENYDKEKQSVEEEYIFATEPISDSSGEVVFGNFKFSIGDWSFTCCLSDGWTQYLYPKEFRIIGFNEKEHQIAFLDFDDDDLDCVDETAEEFIEYYFDYDFTKPTDFS